MQRPKLYLAGPEVFLPNAEEKAAEQRELCERYGFEPLHPMDNNLDFGNRDYVTATRIYRGDIGQVRACDIVVANCNPFRGICSDDGTAYELGFGNALGKPSYGYIRELTTLASRTARDYQTEPWPQDENVRIDREGFLVTDDFGTSINLMLQCGMTDHGGRLIEGSFEDCLQAVRRDLDSGAVSLTRNPAFPRFEVIASINDTEKRWFEPMHVAARRMDTMLYRVDIGDFVLEENMRIRTITQAEKDELNHLADEWAAKR